MARGLFFLVTRRALGCSGQRALSHRGSQEDPKMENFRLNAEEALRVLANGGGLAVPGTSQ
jgi:hypothetical protein